MNKVLIITYYWPPSGGAGVQRWLKFSKYLPEFGWEPVILTVDPKYAAYPATDASLEKEIPAGLKIFRTKAIDWFRLYGSNKSKVPSAGFAINKDDSFSGKLTRFIRGNFFIPDPRRGWNRYAVRKAAEIIQKENIKHVITTSPPHSSQLIGLALKKKFPDVTWIADLRDPWTNIYYYELFYPTVFSRTVDRFYERKVIRKADCIITVGHNLAKALSSDIDGAGEKMHVLPNGYDDDDFTGISKEVPGRFTLTYIGTLSEAYPIDGLLGALASLEKKGIDFVLRFAGSIPEKTRSRISNHLSRDKTEFIPYVSHSDAVKLMCSSSMLILIIPEKPLNNSITTGKVFEYIASRKPVIYIGPKNGDAAYHLRKCGQTGFFGGNDHMEMAEYIRQEMDSGKQMTLNEHPEYSRRILAKELARLLELLLQYGK
jgi:glycosyltransferase involved in cell wall biosynthesis